MWTLRIAAGTAVASRHEDQHRESDISRTPPFALGVIRMHLLHGRGKHVQAIAGARLNRFNTPAPEQLWACWSPVLGRPDSRAQVGAAAVGSRIVSRTTRAVSPSLTWPP
jgi:hypothetical protein